MQEQEKKGVGLCAPLEPGWQPPARTELELIRVYRKSQRPLLW